MIESFGKANEKQIPKQLKIAENRVIAGELSKISYTLFFFKNLTFLKTHFTSRTDTVLIHHRAVID